MKIILLLLASVGAFPALMAAAESLYVYDGASLQPLYGDPQQASCSRWAIWYFKRDTPKIPGTQWGSDTEHSADKVIAQRDASIKDEQGLEAAYRKWNMRYTPPALTHTNNLGPICLAKKAPPNGPVHFTEAKPLPPGQPQRSAYIPPSFADIRATVHPDETFKKLEEGAGTLHKISEGIRALIEANKGFPNTVVRPGGMYIPKQYTEAEGGPIDEYLKTIEENLNRLNTLKDKLTRLDGGYERTVSHGIDAVFQDIQKTEAKLPEMQALFTPPAVVSASSGAQVFGPPVPFAPSIQVQFDGTSETICYYLLTNVDPRFPLKSLTWTLTYTDPADPFQTNGRDEQAMMSEELGRPLLPGKASRFTVHTYSRYCSINGIKFTAISPVWDR